MEFLLKKTKSRRLRENQAKIGRAKQSKAKIGLEQQRINRIRSRRKTKDAAEPTSREVSRSG